MACVLADRPLDDDGDVLLGDLLDDLDVDPAVVWLEEGVVVPELRRGLREAGVVDVEREVVARLDADVLDAAEVDLGLVRHLANLEIY